jgi:hypothetical protein
MTPQDIDDVCTYLEGRGLRSPILHHVVVAVLDQLVVVESTRGSSGQPWTGGGLMVPLARWVIRDDDLQIFQNLLTGCGGFVATGALTPGGTPSKDVIQGAVGILSALFLIGRSLSKKGVHLDAGQFQVLATLRKYGPISADELASRLSWTTGAVWDDGQLQAELNRLRSVALRDGTIVDLVSQDHEGRLNAAGV